MRWLIWGVEYAGGFVVAYVIGHMGMAWLRGMPLTQGLLPW